MAQQNQSATRAQPERVVIHRRAFARTAVTLATAAMGIAPSIAQTVPNSAGTAHPKLKAPSHACDCHMHIYDPVRFPFTPNSRVAPTHAAVPQYRMLQNRIGTTRAVVVTPRNYSVDNGATMDALSQFGP